MNAGLCGVVRVLPSHACKSVIFNFKKGLEKTPQNTANPATRGEAI